jgi:hypothetical protein
MLSTAWDTPPETDSAETAANILSKPWQKHLNTLSISLLVLFSSAQQHITL